MLTLSRTTATSEQSLDRPNLLIEAENATWLQYELGTDQFHLKNKIDVVYIDPPYNTGTNRFVYQDKKPHSEWVQFMDIRLRLLKRYLTSTGVILISIDDKEVHHLRVLMDEIFGAKNFIAQLVMDGGANKNNASFFSVTHEYIIVYSNNKSKLSKDGVKWRRKREGIDLLMRKYRSLVKTGKTPEQIKTILKEWFKTQPTLSPRLKKFYNADTKGLYTYADLSAPGGKSRYTYTVNHPVTGKPVTPPTRGWGLPVERFNELAAQDLILWGDDETKQPLKKLYLQDKKDQLMKSVLAYPARTPTHKLEAMLGKRELFDHPKNLNMMKDLLDYVTPANGTVMDCFAGTGTTGHAVLELNKENGTNRRFILVTNNENNIFDNVTVPRLVHVQNKLKTQEVLEIYTSSTPVQD